MQRIKPCIYLEKSDSEEPSLKKTDSEETVAHGKQTTQEKLNHWQMLSKKQSASSDSSCSALPIHCFDKYINAHNQSL